MGKCKVLEHWFLKEDNNKYLVKEWAKKHSETEIFCFVCSSIVNIKQKGFQGVIQHADTKRHIAECAAKLAPRQLRLTVAIPTQEGNRPSTSKVLTPPPNSTVSPGCVKIYNVADEFRVAELRWVMKCVASNYSAKSCDGIAELFQEIFPCDNSSKFTLSRTKFRYLLTDALGPHFKEEIVKDVGENYFSLLFDETTNAGNRKELETMIRYWSVYHKRIVCHHLESFFIGKAEATDLFEKISESLANAKLPLNKILMLGSDGPNVNKKVHSLMDNKLKLECNQNLVKIGTCNIHIVHNAFSKGLEEFGEDVADLCLQIHNFFDGWPSRLEDFELIQDKQNVPRHRFVKHVPSRWLSLQQSCERLLEQYSAVEEYFLKYIPTKKSSLMKTQKYKKISNLLKRETMKAEVMFICSSSKKYNRFTGFFQREEPLIHILHQELNDLILLLLNPIVKKNKMPKSFEKVDVDTFFKPENGNLSAVKEVICGDHVQAELKSINEGFTVQFLFNVQKHFIAAASHLIKKLKGNFSLKHFGCLQPKKRLSSTSWDDFVKVYRNLSLKGIDVDVLQNEWELSRYVKTKFDKDEELLKVTRIDSYWSEILETTNGDGSVKFPNVAVVVKAALSLSHGNADVERTFSTSGYVMSEEKSQTSVRTLNAFLTVKTVLKEFGNKPQNISINKNLIQLARVAGNRYKAFLDEEKKKKEAKEKEEEARAAKQAFEEEQRKKLENENKILKEKEKLIEEQKQENQDNFRASRKLLEEAKQRLDTALKKKNYDEIIIANSMLEGALAVQREVEQRRKETENASGLVQKRKTNLITQFITKKPKTSQ